MLKTYIDIILSGYQVGHWKNTHMHNKWVILLKNHEIGN
jgi:hypothetical protein